VRYTPSSIRHVVTGFALAGGVTWLGILAGKDDPYYYPTAVSHWDHATRWGSGAIAVVVVGIALAGGLAVACLARGLLPNRLAFALPIPLVLGACAVAFWMAWVALSGGH
jgi:hypothetical protein